MRPDLPWNVAGIPPEAREAARAAARREGLSVGEWLTRRIVGSMTGESEGFDPMRATTSASPSFRSEPAPRPESPVARPEAPPRVESDDVFARATRTDQETQDIYKRVESHLSGLGRRMEATERSAAENNRAMSKAATEINIAAREQAQAFDKLSSHVGSLANRLDRVEHAGTNDSMKE